MIISDYNFNPLMDIENNWSLISPNNFTYFSICTDSDGEEIYIC